jgi:hypothetical protein
LTRGLTLDAHHRSIIFNQERFPPILSGDFFGPWTRFSLIVVDDPVLITGPVDFRFSSSFGIPFYDTLRSGGAGGIGFVGRKRICHKWVA